MGNSNSLPEKNNSNITSEVLYNADKIEYNIDSEISILTDNAKIVYDVHEDYISMIDTFSRLTWPIKSLKIKYSKYKEKQFLKSCQSLMEN